jgi:hypothetical protein
MLASLDFPSASLALACCLGAVSIFLALREWYERNARDGDLSDADFEHFRRQDQRRSLGIGVLLLLAMLLPTGSSLRPGPKSDENLPFLIIWIVVLALVIVLLVLSGIDWLATRTYARRQRRQILRESVEAARNRPRVSVEKRGGDAESPDSIHPNLTDDGK